MSFAVKLSSIAGPSLDRAFEDFVAAANRLGLPVEADINGTPAFAMPGQTVEQVRFFWNSLRPKASQAVGGVDGGSESKNPPNVSARAR